jgi:hypothetical protein
VLDGAGAAVDELTVVPVELAIEEFCVWFAVGAGTTSEPSEVTREMVVVGLKYVAPVGIISPPPVTELESVRTAGSLNGADTVIIAVPES